MKQSHTGMNNLKHQPNDVRMHIGKSYDNVFKNIWDTFVLLLSLSDSHKKAT